MATEYKFGSKLAALTAQCDDFGGYGHTEIESKNIDAVAHESTKAYTEDAFAATVAQ
jgi:hypothetical protein